MFVKQLWSVAYICCNEKEKDEYTQKENSRPKLVSILIIILNNFAKKKKENKKYYVSRVSKYVVINERILMKSFLASQFSSQVTFTC